MEIGVDGKQGPESERTRQMKVLKDLGRMKGKRRMGEKAVKGWMRRMYG